MMMRGDLRGIVRRTLTNRRDLIAAACFQMGAQAPNGACN